MYTNEKKINNNFQIWLSTSLVLVFFIIIIGGLTRLTNSGLSITEWELFEGILFPMNESSWEKYFELYKEIPQYNLLNPNMDINEFKIIFFWEYFHRILARIIGLFFLIPLIYFYFTKKIKKNYLNICYLIFALIVFQGFMGWYMVKSGLVNDVTVSHYRLSIHLLTAFFIISIIFWLRNNFIYKKEIVFFEFSKNNFIFQFLIFLIFLQVILGAFVSGLDAGRVYQTWPLMGESFLPNDLIIGSLKNFVEFDNHSLVQFYHRNLAYIIIFYSIFITIYIYKKKMINLYTPMKFLMFFLLLQVVLGIFTLISGLNILIASIHQITGVLLVLSAINLYYFRVK